MSATVEGFKNKFWKWKKAFESKGLKFNFCKTKVIVIGGIAKDGLSESKLIHVESVA